MWDFFTDNWLAHPGSRPCTFCSHSGLQDRKDSCSALPQRRILRHCQFLSVLYRTWTPVSKSVQIKPRMPDNPLKRASILIEGHRNMSYLDVCSHCLCEHGHGQSALKVSQNRWATPHWAPIANQLYRAAWVWWVVTYRHGSSYSRNSPPWSKYVLPFSNSVLDIERLIYLYNGVYISVIIHERSGRP